MRRIILAALLVGAAGCLFEPARRYGSATLVWSVQSTFDPRACDAHGATEAIVEVYDENGALATRVRASCDRFQVTILLDRDFYSARVVLVDPRLAPVSTSANVPPFFVSVDRDTRVDVDFPSSSFFATTTRSVPDAGLE